MSNASGYPQPLVVTRELVLAVFKANEALIGRVHEVQRSEEYTHHTQVGVLLRQAVEKDLQSHAMLKDWVARHMDLVGLSKEDLR